MQKEQKDKIFTLLRMKIKNCIFIWKKDNIFCNNEKVPCLSYKKRDFLEKLHLLLNFGGEEKWEGKPEKPGSIF